MLLIYTTTILGYCLDRKMKMKTSYFAKAVESDHKYIYHNGKPQNPHF